MTSRRSAGALLLMAFAAQAGAQDIPVPPTDSKIPTPGAQVPGAAAGAAAGAEARVEKSQPPSWFWVPRISAREEYSDNVRHVADAIAESAWTTFLVPGIHLEHAGPRLAISGDYSYTRSFHGSGKKDLDDSENLLAANASYNVIDKTFVIDGRASITQENRSAFAASVVPGTTNPNANRAETRLFTISPVVRGTIGDAALWQARVNESSMRTKGDFQFGDTDLQTTEVVAGVRSSRVGARLGWNLEGTALQSRSDNLGTLDDQRIRADLIFGVNPQLHLLLIEGYEKTDFTSSGTQSGDTPGAGFEWAPGPRTQMSAVVQRRFFGTGHLAIFDHRTSRLAIRITSTKDSTVLTSVLGATAGTFQALLDNLLVYSVRDPFARSDAARNRLSNLGYAPTVVSTGFLTERPFVYHSDMLSLTYLGTRATVTASYERRDQTALGPALGITDSFTLSDNIKQRSYRVSGNYRLTPRASVTMAVSGNHTRGADGSNLSSKEDLATLYLSSQLGPRTTGSFGVRRVDFEGLPTNYRDNVVFATIEFRLH